jgi:hypothetical protein
VFLADWDLRTGEESIGRGPAAWNSPIPGAYTLREKRRYKSILSFVKNTNAGE